MRILGNALKPQVMPEMHERQKGTTLRNC